MRLEGSQFTRMGGKDEGAAAATPMDVEEKKEETKEQKKVTVIPEADLVHCPNPPPPPTLLSHFHSLTHPLYLHTKNIQELR